MRTDERLDACGQDHDREDGQGMTASQRIRQAQADGSGLEHPEVRSAAEGGQGQDELVVCQDEADHQEVHAAAVAGEPALRPRRGNARG